MANNKQYVDITGLEEFLKKLKEAYAANTADKFMVNQATYASKALGEEGLISETYLKKSVAETTYVANTVKIANVAIGSGISATELRTAINVEDGSQANKLEAVALTDASGTKDLSISDKKVTIDLSGYALKSEITNIFRFKGVVANVASLPTGAAIGDVYHVAENHGEYVWVAGDAMDSNTAHQVDHWEELGTVYTTDLSGYYTSAQIDEKLSAKVDTSTYDTKVADIEGKITAANGDITAINGKIDVINGEEAGSIKKALADAKAYADGKVNGLSSTGPAAGSHFISNVVQENGAVTVTGKPFLQAMNAETEDNTLSAKAISSYVGTELSTAFNEKTLDEVGGTGKFISAVSQAAGKVSATAVAFVTDLSGTVDNSTAPGTKAMKDYADGCKVLDAEGGSQITSMTAISTTAIDALFSK